MASKKTFSYQTRLYFIVNVFLWILVFVFVTIQYSREREYKASILNARLQVCNEILLDEYAVSGSVAPSVVRELLRDDSLRITVINRSGDVLFDTHGEVKLSNHLNRPEIAKALASGDGYTVRRASEADNKDYFYSASADDNVIVRTAVPYDVTLMNVLKGDMAYVWVILGITVIINIILYFAIRRISLGVKNLWEFAGMAEKGNIQDYDVSNLPDDELGEVSSAIIRLYKKLEHTSHERDQRLQEALFEEKEKIRIKHQLTSNINHELKTPVQAIRGCFETLLNNELDKETIKRLLENGYGNTMRLNDLLQDVALITRISDEKNTLELSEVNIRNVVDHICEEVEEYSVEKRMRVNVSVPENAVVKGNRQLIDAIFRNLVNNAVQYSGGRDIFITMTKETPDYYWFDVYDNGGGVEEKHLSHIFERFYRIDSGRSRQSGGTGLGLSIVRNSVQFHQGEIKAQNHRYAGLEFVFSLHK